jgi:hypothetical protein
MQVKPKSLMEVEEITQGFGESLLQTKHAKSSFLDTHNYEAPKMDPKINAIFNKDYHTEQRIKPVTNSFIEEQRALKTQRELETQRKFLQQELDITKK